MVLELGRVGLKSGEKMRLVKTLAPEPDWLDHILPFLHHKGEFWLEPMRQAYTSGLGELLMSDFLGLLENGEVVGNITTLEYLGVGILQHVFTPPQHRRKGICNALMQVLCDDFVARGGRAMYLGTGHDTPPFHIYEGFGFRGRGDSGKMTWLADPEFFATHFAPADTTIRDTRWEDWPLLEALYAVTGQWQLKGFLLGQFGHAGYEHEYIELRRRMQEGRIADVKVMISARGAVVGHALIGKQPSWGGRPLALDLMVHANFHDRLGELISALNIPEGHKVQAFCEVEAEAKIAALEAAGFEREAVLRGQFEDEDHRMRDVVVMRR